MSRRSPLPDASTDERSCADWLAQIVWPGGFRCHACDTSRHYRLESRPRVFVCASCKRHRSVTAGTALHRSKVPLRIWFAAARYMARPGGISASAFSRAVGLRYETAWRLLHKLRAGLGETFRVLRGAVELSSCWIRTRPDGTDRAPRHRASWQGVEGVIALVDAGRHPARSVTFHRAAEREPRALKIRLGRQPSKRAARVLDELRDVLLNTFQGVGRRWLGNYLLEHQFRFNRHDTEDLPSLVLTRAASRRWTRWSDLAGGAHEAPPMVHPRPMSWSC